MTHSWLFCSRLFTFRACGTSKPENFIWKPLTNLFYLVLTSTDVCCSHKLEVEFKIYLLSLIWFLQKQRVLEIVNFCRLTFPPPWAHFWKWAWGGGKVSWQKRLCAASLLMVKNFWKWMLAAISTIFNASFKVTSYLWCIFPLNFYFDVFNFNQRQHIKGNWHKISISLKLTGKVFTPWHSVRDWEIFPSRQSIWERSLWNILKMK